MVILSKKGNLVFAIIALTLALGLFVGAFCLYFFSGFQQPTDKSFTFKMYKEIPAYRTTQLELHVFEESKALTISTLANRYINKEALLSIQNGDVIQCKTVDSNNTDYCYQIVELIANGNVILSLENAHKAEKNNATVGVVIISVLSVIFLVFSAILFHRVKYGYSARYKNAEKKTIKRVLLEHAKTNGMNPQETQRLIKMIDSIDMSDNLPCEKDELLNAFKNSFYVKNNREYTTAGEYLSNQGCHKVFREALQNVLQEDELRVCYDAGLTDDSALYLLYKIKGKIVDGYIFKNDETGKFPVDNLDLSGDLYDIVKLTRTERAQLIEKLREYNRLSEEIFDIDRNLM